MRALIILLALRRNPLPSSHYLSPSPPMRTTAPTGWIDRSYTVYRLKPHHR